MLHVAVSARAFGFTYFSVAVTMQSFTNVMPAIIAGGAYCFTELFRFYKVNNINRGLRLQKKKIKKMVFLI